MEYQLYVDENARPGTRSIKVQYQDDEGMAWKEKILDIWAANKAARMNTVDALRSE